MTRPTVERALATEAVTQAAGGEEQAREHERVRVDHPLQVADAGAEVAHQRGQGHVDDRVVDHDHEQAHAEDRQRGPAAPMDAVVEPVLGSSVEVGGEGNGFGEDVTVAMGELLRGSRRYDTVIST